MAEQERTRAREREEEAGPLPRIAVTPSGPLRCPYCHGELGRDMLAARCELCRTAHHASCFAENGACSVHGCRGRAAHVGAVTASAERQPFDACRACHAAIFLDERAALCRKCDAPHHPACLESRGSCCRCGSRDATLMAATEFARVSADLRKLHARSSLPAIITGALLLVASVVAGVLGGREICILLAVCSIAEFALGAVVLLRSKRVASIASPPEQARRENAPNDRPQ
ncbi:MAG TPA: hypothetical protein VFF73_27055 [Planctomycetota bacterium]|nr:hypothetical protein [Planctomycetota bacterium]